MVYWHASFLYTYTHNLSLLILNGGIKNHALFQFCYRLLKQQPSLLLSPIVLLPLFLLLQRQQPYYTRKHRVIRIIRQPLHFDHGAICVVIRFHQVHYIQLYYTNNLHTQLILTTQLLQNVIERSPHHMHYHPVCTVCKIYDYIATSYISCFWREICLIN